MERKEGFVEELLAQQLLNRLGYLGVEEKVIVHYLDEFARTLLLCLVGGSATSVQ